jgi:Clp amino terminal domain, pathogenicity island component
MTPPPSLQDLIDTVRRDTATDSPIDQLVTAASTVADLEDTSDALLGHFVDRCRREGRSWSEISAALGVTKQAVHKRFAAGLADRIIQATPEPTFERFTQRARHVVSAARELAGRYGHRQAGSEHLLLAQFEEREGIAAIALTAMGVSAESVRTAMLARRGAGTTQSADPAGAADPEWPAAAGSVDTSPDGRLALRNALVIALELGHNYIGTEHLLLGLYLQADSPAAVILAEAGASEAETRTRVLEMLRGYQRPQPG